ncbi:ScyD/ScyE family protein [Georgenia wangjunii]|uniref:ScyD/ScyE family protein n=1 Tax=Georgenia wangjunii TaxID=3117730 RepID=UPI002F2604B7
MQRSWKPLALGAAGALALGLALAPPAAAHGSHPRPDRPVTVAENLVSPLTFDVERPGTLYVGQAFAGALTRIDHRGRSRDLVGPHGIEIAAVSTHRGTLTWAETAYPTEEGGELSAVIKQRSPNGRVRQIADLDHHEATKNPDGRTTYGFQGLSPECLATLPPGPLAPYQGLVDSHPYGSVTVGGELYVADAAANAVLKVDRWGKVRTVAVLPGTPVRITAEMAEANGVDPCVAGHVMMLESVPTDVEVGRNGLLYVSTLPGGPEDGSLGANGSVYTVEPWSGRVRLLARGFAGATNLAVAPDGTVYVAELFGNEVSAISRRGKVSTVATLNQPAGVEWSDGRLYVSTDAFGAGKIVTLRASSGRH